MQIAGQTAGTKAEAVAWLDLPSEYNAVTDFVDRHLAEGRAKKTAFIDDDGAYSYTDLADGVNRFASVLGELDIGEETRIALCMLDSFDLPCCFWGAIKAGVVPVLLNTLLTAEAYRFILEDCRAQAAVVSQQLLPVLWPVLGELPGLRAVIVSGGGSATLEGAGIHRLGPCMKRVVPRADCAATHPDDVAFWLYSSGSTGQPKGVRHLHRNLAATAQFYAQPLLELGEDDVVFSAAKLFFAYGLGNGMTFPLSVGATAVLLAGRPTPKAVMACLAERQPTLFFGVPTLYAAILADPASGQGGWFSGSLSNGGLSGRLRLCVSAGEALPEDIGRRWEERFGVPILDGVGSTEMLHIYLSNRQGEIRYGTSGKPVPGYAVRLVDEAGQEVGEGEIGELLVSGPSVCEGYWRRRQRNLETFVGYWMHTGDKYLCDGQGYYTYCGRSDDMFKSGGNWVSPFQVESALIAHKAVVEAGVIGQNDRSGNMKPKAYVVLQEGVADGKAMEQELQDFVKDRIELWKYPRWIVFVDSLPKTATGKVQRFKLRALGGG